MTEQCDQKLISRDFLNIYYKKLLQQTSNGAYILTSHDFSWLQNGQLNCVSNGSIAFRFVGGFLLLFLLPIYLHRKRKLKIKKKNFHWKNIPRLYSNQQEELKSHLNIVLEGRHFGVVGQINNTTLPLQFTSIYFYSA